MNLWFNRKSWKLAERVFSRGDAKMRVEAKNQQCVDGNLFSFPPLDKAICKRVCWLQIELLGLPRGTISGAFQKTNR